MFAAVIATVSGALYPMLRGFVSPELLFFSTSGTAVITVLLGGVGTLMGALYGSVLLTVLQLCHRQLDRAPPDVIGLLFMGAVIFLPSGLMGLVRPAVERLLARRAPADDRAGARGPRPLDQFRRPARCRRRQLAAERNRITTLIGPNGAGKSTLFNLISGALRAALRRRLRRGHRLHRRAAAPHAGAGVARSFQITNLLFELPVAENLRLAAQVLEQPRAALAADR